MGSFLQAFLEIYSKAHENSLQKEVVYGHNCNKNIWQWDYRSVFKFATSANILVISVADPGCLSRIPDPNFSIPDSWSKRSASNNPSLFNPKIVSKLSEIWSGMFIPDPNLDFLPIPNPRSRAQKGTGSRIRNTAGYEITDMNSDLKLQENSVPLLWCYIYDCICITASK